jgi:hypothetical protein
VGIGDERPTPGRRPQAAEWAQVKQVATYVPTTIIAAYVGLTALLGNQQATLAVVVFFIFWALTPLSVVAATPSVSVASKVVAPKTPKEAWPAIASAIAFAAWVAALPGSVLVAHVGWLTSQVGGVIVVVTSIAVGAVATLVSRGTS